ncbi:hypothetical protein [Porphyrobacter sp. GA68]|uniref:hypothetical protein n=1 Tax=Porphyrobacter sp. GA68 TaxID=2883480 RepID=UPI001D196F20|nr:hypothetical protein [Porphyrobacter sp. GA68]
MMNIVVASPTFFSDLDEKMFFWSLAQNPVVTGFKGVGESIEVQINEGNLDLESFLSIYALLKRYCLNCKILQDFLMLMREDDVLYLKDGEKIWFEDIFAN